MTVSTPLLRMTSRRKTFSACAWVTLSEEDVMGKTRGASTYNPTSGEVQK